MDEDAKHIKPATVIKKATASNIGSHSYFRSIAMWRVPCFDDQQPDVDSIIAFSRLADFADMAYANHRGFHLFSLNTAFAPKAYLSLDSNP